MKKVIKFVKGKRDDKKDGGITPSQSGDLMSPSQTPEDERFLGLDNAAGYIVDFCGKDKSLTKLHKASWQGNLDKVKNALKKIEIDVVDRHNRTALHFAVVQGHPNIVWFLLGNNARHTICDHEGRTALLKAVECGHKESMNLLLERGANANHADFSGNTCIHLAAKQSSLEMTTILLEKGADVDIANNSGEYPLHIAVHSQNKDMAELLLRGGASVNAVDRENRTPLMLAAKTGNMLLAQLFIESGAQLFAVDSNGWTAEDYAMLNGYQAVAAEIKNLMKKDTKPQLETHTEEDEVEVSKSEQESSWNDSHLSDASGSKKTTKIGQFIKTLSVESEGGQKSEKDDDLESPGSGVVPPPCQPPRSWEIIEAGMIDEATVDGAEPKRRSITALGSLHSRKESFTDISGNQGEGPKYTLSLNRRKDVKKGNVDVKHRFSFNEEDSLRSSLSDDFSLRFKEEKELLKLSMPLTLKEEVEKQKNDSGSDWDSHLSSLLDSGSLQINKPNLPLKDSKQGTSEHREPMKQVKELIVEDQDFPEPPPKLPEKVEEESEASSSWDSGENYQDATAFPPPPTAFELGVDMAKSIRSVRGVSVDHGHGYSVGVKVWRKSYDEQSHSLDSLGEKEPTSTEAIIVEEKAGSSKRHARQPSIANYKWHSVELPQQQRPSNRLVDVNRRISEQLECYDQALRELAESPYAKRQDAIISTLKEPTSSKIDNYYSLPSSKLRRDLDLPLPFRHGPCAMSLPPQISMKFENTLKQTSSSHSLRVREIEITHNSEVENNEKLGFEEKLPEKPKGLDFAPAELTVVDNLESPISDELTSSDKSDRKSKRHMLLAMRDVKHAVQVVGCCKSSMDEHILSPLTKVDGEFDLSPSKDKLDESESEEASPPNEPAFFSNDTEGLFGRQGTVIEKPGYQGRSSPSDSGEEPTLWLQDKIEGTKVASAPTSDDEAVEGPKRFSPLGALYEEFKAERKLKKRYDSPEESQSSDCGQDKRMASAALQRLQRLDSSSENEESFHERREKKKNVGEEPDGSPDLSFSSGPVEPLGKDSGSDPDSSQQEVTPVHQFSLKKHHKWLKEKLQSENKERHQLEEVAAQLAEKAERLQYELADAREATKSRDEIIALLQGQLSRMENAYTKSLEESVHCRLQLTTLEQEILHLKELCAQYEEERESRVIEGVDKQCAELSSKIRQLEEEKEGLSRVVVRLEHENRTLERKSKKEDTKEEKRWTERSLEGYAQMNAQEENCLQGSAASVDAHNLLKIKNAELESEIRVISDINKQLQQRLGEELSTRKYSHSHEEINESIILLNKKNTELENQLQLLIEELRESKKYENQSSYNSLKKGDAECLESGNDINHAHIEILQKENLVLTNTIQEMKEEINRLKNLPNQQLPNNSSHDDITNDESENSAENSNGDFEAALKENKKLSEDIDVGEEIKSDGTVPKEVEDLKKEVQGLKEALEEAKKGGVALESQMNRLKDGKGGDQKGARANELAWTNLYGIKHVRQTAARATPTTNGRPPSQSLLHLDKDSEEFIEIKVRELEAELEKAKEEILKQRLESNIKMQEILAPRSENVEVFQLKSKVLDLEREIRDEKQARSFIDRTAIEIGFGLKDKRLLEFELDHLKSRVQRDYVPKEEAEAMKFHLGLVKERKPTKSDPTPSVDLALVETLAREQQRADELERRLGRETNWGTKEWGISRKKLENLNKEKPTVYLSSSTPCLDEDTKVKLTQQLEESIKRYYGSPREAEETSPLKEDLLRRKFLC